MAITELIHEIQMKQNELTAGQRRVAAYVIGNYARIPFLSITELAHNIGVSENTVVKFCNSMGYERFGSFKKAFSDYAHSELTILNRLYEGKTLQNEENLDAFQLALEEDIGSIQSTMNDPMNRESIPKLLDMIEQADNIYVTGGRSSAMMAGLFAAMLRYLDLTVIEVNSGVGDYLDRMAAVKPTDLIIAFSFSQYTAMVVDILRELSERGASIALITDTGLSPAAAFSKLTLHCNINSTYYFHCLAGCLSLISLIARMLAARRTEKSAQHIQQLEKTLREREDFYSRTKTAKRGRGPAKGDAQ